MFISNRHTIYLVN
uniref:Uncharacterized protein n=1 Tax=Rhizophora mucronata TaxID=61149 RepID=A0A2P2N6I9_RHIMU